MAAEENRSPDTDEETFPLRVGSEAGERLLGWLLLGGTIALAVMSFAPKAATRFYTWPWILYWHVLLTLTPLAFVLGAATRRPFPRLGASLDLGLFLWAAVALAGAWWSPFRHPSMDAALLPLASVCLAYVLRGWMGFDPTESRRRAAQVFTIVGLLAAAFVVVSWGYWIAFDVRPARAAGTPWSEVWLLRNEHPLGHANYTAGFVVLTLAMLVSQAITTRGLRRMGWSLAAIAGVLLEPVTNSRGGLLGVLVLLVGAGVVAVSTVRFQWRTRVLLFGGALVAVVLAVALCRPLRAVLAHSEWSPVAAEQTRLRTSMAEAGWRMGVARPWIGWGPGTVSRVYPRYRAGLPGGADNVLELHSTPVQVWAESGVIGLLAWLAVGVGVGMRAWRLRVGGVAAHAGTRADRTRAWAIVFGLGAYAIFSLTDHQLDLPLFAGVMVALLAILSVLTRPARLAHVTWSPTLLRVVPAVLVAGAIALIAWYARADLLARQVFWRGVLALEEGDDDGFVTGAQHARALAPWEPFYVNQYAFHVIDQADASDERGETATLRARAIELLQQSLAIAPGQEICETNLGWLYLDDGKPGEAERHFRAAARLVPERGGVYFGLGLALLLQRREDEAVRALALEWINDPRAITHPVWTRPDWQARRDAVAATAHALLADLASRNLQPRVTRTAAYVHALLSWWIEPTPERAARVVATAMKPEQQAFFFAVHAGEPAPGTDDAPWRIVQRAWAAPEPRVVLATLPDQWAPWREALAQRIAEHRESFAEFLTGPGARTDRLIWYQHTERLAYGMLARNSDGLRIIDRTPREDNVLVDLLPPSIFPAKGWVPGPVMIRWLDTGL